MSRTDPPIGRFVRLGMPDASRRIPRPDAPSLAERAVLWLLALLLFVTTAALVAGLGLVTLP